MLKININQFGVDIRNFVKGEKIGKGGYSDVFLAQYKKTGANYAAKVLKNNVFKDEEKSKIENEIEIMIDTNHPTIIKFYGYSLLDFNSLTNIVIFEEFAKNGSLSKIIASAKKSNPPSDYDNTSRQIILIGVSCGMKYLHDKKIMHRDLNTNNILLDENYYPHITDFGMAKYIHKKDLFEDTPIIGTLPYMAPEMILADKYSYKIDVYSFGILMYEVLCEADLYPEIADIETFTSNNSITNEYRNHIAVSHNRPEFTKEVKKSLKDLIENCWSSDPKERPTFDEIFDKLTSPKYYLDNVDEKRIKKYINFLSKSEKNCSKDFELIEKVDRLSKENQNLRDQIKSLKENNEKLSNECNQLKQLLSEKSDTIIPIQPPTSKEEKIIMNSPRFHHFKDKKENDTIIIKIGDVKQKLMMNDEKPPQMKQRSLMIEDQQLQNKILNNDKQIQQRLIKMNDENQLKQKPLLNDEKQLQQKIIKLNSDKQMKQKALINDDKQNKIKMINNEKQMKQKSSINDFQKQAKLMKMNDDKQLQLATPQQEVKKETPTKSPVMIIHEKEKKPDEVYFTPIKEKINGQLLIPSTTPRRLPQFSNKEEELNPRALTPQRVKISGDNKLPQLHKSKKIIITKDITVSEFNSYSIEQQYQFISAKANSISSLLAFMKNQNYQYISNLQKFLNLFFQYVTSPDASNYIEIQAENQEEKFDDINDMNQLKIMTKTTELLYHHKILTSPEFYQISKLFKRISIEIQYFSKFYQILYKTIFPLNHLKIDILISGIKKTDNTFKGNKFIKSIRFDESVVSISDYAFENCYSLKSVLFSSSVESIGFGSFEGCNSLKSVSIPPSITSVGVSAFKGCSELEEVSMNNTIKSIRNNTFYGCKSLKKVSIPSSVSSICDYAFYDCSSLESVSIPSSVVSIGEFAFAECSELKKIFIPYSVKSIGKCAFKGCSALEELSIPSSISNVSKLGINEDCKIVKT